MLENSYYKCPCCYMVHNIKGFATIYQVESMTAKQISYLPYWVCPVCDKMEV